MDPVDYRKLQLEAVSNLSGSNVVDVLATASMGLVSYATWKAMTKQTLQPAATSHGGVVLFLLEFMVLVVCPILASTLTDWIPYLVVGLCTMAVSTYLFQRPDQQQLNESKKATVTSTTLSILSSSRKPFLDAYRSTMMLMTCISILGVDFMIYPRRFAKTETYGVSLMDIGVGCVVFSSSLVTGSALRRSGSFWVSIRRAFLSAVPLATLGFIRLASVKGIEYQEHVSEYGVHWNFFFTLTFVPIFVCLCTFTFGFERLGIASFLISIAYQYMLTQHGLAAYIMDAPRIDMISMNREGIFSLFGYVSIYLFGVQFGGFLLRPRKTLVEWRIALKNAMYLDLALWFMYYCTTHVASFQVSRRMANFPYFLWVVAFNVLFVTIFAIIDLVIGPARPSIILQGINRNQLFVFLLGNLLTGAINMSIQTLLQPAIPSLCVMTCYMFTICGVAAFLHARNLTLKFW